MEYHISTDPLFNVESFFDTYNMYLECLSHCYENISDIKCIKDFSDLMNKVNGIENNHISDVARLAKEEIKRILISKESNQQALQDYINNKLQFTSTSINHFIKVKKISSNSIDFIDFFGTNVTFWDFYNWFYSEIAKNEHYEVNTGFNTRFTTTQIEALYELMKTKFFDTSKDCFLSIFSNNPLPKGFRAAKWKIITYQNKPHKGALREFIKMMIDKEPGVKEQNILNNCIVDVKGNKIILRKPKLSEYSSYYIELEKILNKFE